MQPDGVGVFVEEFGHLFLGKPKRFPLQPYVHPDASIGILVEHDLAAFLVDIHPQNPWALTPPGASNPCH